MSNFSQFEKAVQDWVIDTKGLCVGVARGISVEIFNELLSFSPQYSGDYAANWKYAVDSVDQSFTPLMFVHPGRQEHGHLERYLTEARHPNEQQAVHWAKAANAGRDKQVVRLGQTINISNSAIHDDDLYAWKIEHDRINFRPVNIGHGVVAAHSVKEIAGKYINGITHGQALALALKHIGV